MQLKLEVFTRLSGVERGNLDRIASRSVRVVEPRRDIVREGDRPRCVHLILEGWAARYKQLPDGRRQIVSFLLPGDLCDANVYILKEMDHSIGAISRVRVAEIAPDEFEEVIAQSPRIARALWWNELVASAVAREWTLNLGQRSAYERIAHLLCELFVRCECAGLTSQQRCEFPLTQVDIADATGLTAVHVNRTLQELRRDGLIELQGRVLTMLDEARLKNVAFFNPNYLHLDREGRHLDAVD